MKSLESQIQPKVNESLILVGAALATACMLYGAWPFFGNVGIKTKGWWSKMKDSMGNAYESMKGLFKRKGDKSKDDGGWWDPKDWETENDVDGKDQPYLGANLAREQAEKIEDEDERERVLQNIDVVTALTTPDEDGKYISDYPEDEQAERFEQILPDGMTREQWQDSFEKDINAVADHQEDVDELVERVNGLDAEDIESRVDDEKEIARKFREETQPEPEEVVDKETGEKVKAVVHTGPRGGRFYYPKGQPKTPENRRYIQESLQDYLLQSLE